MLSDLEKREALTLLRELISISSPSGREQKLADYIYKWLSKKGFQYVTIDKAGNVRARTQADKPVIAYCGHMDTIPGTLPVFMRDGRIYGRGASDAKGPLAAMLYSAQLISQKNFPLEVIAVVQEERSSQGIKYLIKQNLNQKFMVFGEPSGASKIVVGYRGRIEVTVDFYASGFHASMPWVGKSALQYALDFARNIEDYAKGLEVKDRSNSVSLCITSLNSGIARNVAPPHARLVLDIRVPERFEADEIVKNIEKFCRSTGVPKFEVNIGEKVDAASSPSGFLLRAMRRSIFKSLGIPAKVVRKTGTGDMNYAIKNGIEAITYGPGDGLSEHSQEESIDIEDYFRAIEVLTMLPEELSHVLSEKEI
ncbi:MAG: M20/M25/M40 family metallo-hydrolase [Conexivisphaerales archaeon]